MRRRPFLFAARPRGLSRRASGGLTGAVALLAVAVTVPLTAGSASAAPRAAAAHRAAAVHQVVASHGWRHHCGHWTRTSNTTVTTAPGIASTLIGAGVVPFPVLPKTGFKVTNLSPLQVAYRFPITSNTADLATGTGHIRHSGGIVFVGKGTSLEIGKFDINLAKGKVYARQVNYAKGNIAVLDLDLSGLKVTQKHHTTVLSGIKVRLDGAAAGALNATFGLALPTDGSLVFGHARVAIKG